LQRRRTILQDPRRERDEHDQQRVQGEEPVLRGDRAEPSAVVLGVALRDR
jgi:hypothetical protein